MFTRSTLILALSTIPLFVTGTCYTRNGTLITDIAYQPCSSTGESACCGINHDGAGHSNVANDVCDTNGLCQNYEAFDGTNEGVKLWWRQGCTDPTWASPNCLANVCDTPEYEDDNAPVYSCGNGNWACGRKSYCSTSSRLFTLAATVGRIVVASTIASATTSLASSVSRSVESTPFISTATPSGSGPSSVTTPTTATATATSALPTSTTPVPTPAFQPLLGTAAKAGIGAGIAVFLLLLGIIIFLLHKLKKHRKAQNAYDKAELPGQNATSGVKPETTMYAHEVSQDPVEMPCTEGSAYEMNAGKERMELETRERASELGLQRERVELASTPSLSGTGRYA